jgi:hypothetical protein
MIRGLGKFVLTPFLLVAPAAAASYDINEVKLGADEAAVKRAFPSARCKPLEWESRAAERRCDDSRAAFGGVSMRVTFYLRKNAVQAFDLRFSTGDVERLAEFLKSRYGAPASETRDEIERKGKSARRTYRAVWERDGERAVLTALFEKRTASLLVSRGNFEEEIYRVR